MNKKFILQVSGIAAAACFLVCEPVPKNAIADARSVLEKAEKSGGRIWAPAQLRTGHACYDSAMKELSAEKRKLPFMRNYKKIIDLLDIAAEAGHYALESMHAAKERMKSESRDLLDRAKVLADSVDGVLKAAANKTSVRRLRAALDSAGMARREALAAIDSGDPFLAEERATSALEKTENVVKRTAELFPPPEKSEGMRK